MTPVVFVGQIENIGDWQNLKDKSTDSFSIGQSSMPIRFKVKKVYKGRLGRRITVWTVPEWEWYGYHGYAPVIHTKDADGKPVDKGSLQTIPNPPETEYLIFAYYEDMQFEGAPKRKVLTVSMCSRSAKLSERADDIRYIEAQRTKNTKLKPSNHYPQNFPPKSRKLLSGV